MTKIKYYSNKRGTHFELLARGHSGYANSGSDIVCAGISTLTQTLVEYLDNNNVKVESQIKDGYLSIKADGDVSVAFDFTLHGLKLIESSYPIYLKVEKTYFPFL